VKGLDEASVGGVDCEVLCVHGAADQVVPLEGPTGGRALSQALAARGCDSERSPPQSHGAAPGLPNLVVLEGASHNFMFERPAEVAKVLMDFMKAK